MSGIISLLSFAIIQAHYSWYNLSPQGKATTSVTYEFLGKTAEATVYSYVGISLYTSIPGYWSFALIMWQLIIIVVGRVIAVIGTFYLFRLCFRKKTINFRELMFITYGGMIRGAIAFALVLKIPFTCSAPVAEVECIPNDLYEMARSTTLVIVMATTLFFGTFMKKTQSLLLGEQKESDHHDFSGSVYEEIMHPNQNKSTIVSAGPLDTSHLNMTHRATYLLGRGGEQGGFPNSAFANWFAEFDENKIRPFLIRNYTLEAVETMVALNQIMTKNFDDKEPDKV
jgi:hypothetical protein